MIEVDVSSRLGDFSLSAKFAVNSGIAAIFGKSGAGKSSLIRMIAGLSAPDSGRIVLGERVVFDRTSSISVPIQQRGVGMVFQDSRLFPHMNVERNLLYSQWAAGRKSAVGLGEIAELLGIAHLLKRRPHGFPVVRSSVWRLGGRCFLIRSFLCWMSRWRHWMLPAKLRSYRIFLS